MKTIVTGVLAFVIWSAVSTYWYVNKIKDFPAPTFESSAQESFEDPRPAAEPEPSEVPKAAAKLEIKKPGAFTLKHGFDRSEFVEEVALSAFMEQLTKYMEQNDRAQIQISSHTDDLGSSAYNQSLAKKRATVVTAMLTEHGIPDARIQIRALGEQEPITDNSTEEGRAMNRRTTIEIK